MQLLNKRLILSFFLIFMSVQINAQKSDQHLLPTSHYFVKHRMTVSAAFTKMPLKSFHPNILEGNMIKGVDIKVLYGINGWLELGTACNVSLLKRTNVQFPDQENPSVFHKTIIYAPIYQGYIGETAKAHLLSIFWPCFTMADIFVSAFAGGYYGYIPMWSKGELGLNIQGGIGLGFNPSRNWGFYFEYGISNQTKTQMTFGINVRFNGPKKWQR